MEGAWLGVAMEIAPNIFGTVLIPAHQTNKLFNTFLIDFATFGRGCQFRVTKHPGIGVAAGPGNQGGWSGAEKVYPIKRIILVVKANGSALDQVLSYIVSI